MDLTKISKEEEIEPNKVLVKGYGDYYLENTCPRCGKFSYEAKPYCPYCGQKIKQK